MGFARGKINRTREKKLHLLEVEYSGFGRRKGKSP